MSFATFYHLGPGQVRDFRALRAAGYLVLHQPHHLYDLAAQQTAEDTLDPPHRGVLPFYHLSYEALAYAPFTLFRDSVAYKLSVCANMLLLLGCFLSARPTFSRVIPTWQPRPGLAIFMFVPVYWTIMQGQDSLLLLLICCFALRALEQDRDAQAGATLALALFKFQIALPLVLLLAVRRGWRVIAGFVPVGVLLLGASAALVGRPGLADLKTLLSASSAALAIPFGAPPAGQTPMSVPASMPNLRGLLFASLGRAGLGQGTVLAAVLLLSILTLAWGAIEVRRVRSREEAFGLAILCAVLVSYHLNLHDATVLILPFCIWGARRTGQLLLIAPMGLIFLGPAWLSLLSIPILLLFLDAARVAARERPGEYAAS
jgi:hypothetical protein